MMKQNGKIQDAQKELNTQKAKAEKRIERCQAKNRKCKTAS